MEENKNNFVINYLDKAIERTKTSKPSNKKGLLLILEKSIELVGNIIGNIVKFAIWIALFFAAIGVIGFIVIAPFLLMAKLFK